MKLQGRGLSNGIQGDGVQRLHKMLQPLDYEIGDREQSKGRAEKDAEEAVRNFQRKRRLRPTDEADAQTLRLMEEGSLAVACPGGQRKSRLG